MDKNGSFRFIFVCGVGRSGTSLLQSMLAAHPEVSFPPETSFLRRYLVNGVITKNYAKHGAKAATQLLKKDDYFQRTGLDVNTLLNQAMEMGIVTDGSVYRSMLIKIGQQERSSYVGDKDPRCIEFLGVVRHVLADSHIVHVIRDARDVLVSKKKAAWSSKHSTIRHIFANRVQLRMGRAHGLRLFGNNYHEVVYEKLLNDPEGELTKLCEGFGLTYSSSMMDFKKSAKKLVSEKEISWKKETLGPLLRTNYGKWANELAPWEIALTEQVCGAQFEAGGYKRNNVVRLLPLWQRIIIYGMVMAIVCIEPIYRAYRSWTVWRARLYT